MGEARLDEFDAAEVHAQLQLGPAFLLPLADLADGFEKRPQAQAPHATGFGRQRDDVGDRIAREERIAATQQGFDRGRRAGGGVDARLVFERERAILDGATQLRVFQVATVRAGVHAGGVEPIAAAALLLGAIQREIGLGEQPLEFAAVLRADTDADAGADVHLVVVHLERAAQRLDQRLGHGAPDFGRTGIGHQHRELVAAQACDEVGIAHGAAHALRGLLQQRIAERMAEAIVDFLEVVQIQQQHQQQLPMALCGRAHGNEAVVEFGAVGQSGEAVFQCEPRGGFDAFLFFGRVAQDLDVADLHAVAAAHRIQHAVGPEQRTVLAQVPAEIARAPLATGAIHFLF
jgi:hypothetical protein